MRSSNHRRGSLVLAVLALTLALAACGGSGDTDNSDTANGTTETSEAQAAAPAANEVVIRLIAFKPEQLAVKTGTTVTWRQTDASAHTVTSGTVTQGAGDVTPNPDGKFESGNLAQGDTFEFTFDEPGTFPFFCALHPATMRGEVQVA